ncbi:hypothetical protein GCM10010300_85080 [Streptomyces olivaceoviridis]|uniref:hypothetical protein n=1 Tax=Streptomyces olivaceoviridis TaxID=1921 RepID=UPI001677D924|nr:hypothetical protein [Streptomyces olivaceoviridis]GGZ29063.1 hypothetical protein GCM10010300_85080 [Streptomyces olivaceoviridis]
MRADQGFHFPPILNGMDFLSSAVDQLTNEEGENSLKYAVLHLQAAAEVLLKVRLTEEHWSLVFKNPGLASRDSYDSGDFESCTLEGAMERLEKISGISIPEKSKGRIKRLSRHRNQLQHYGAKLESSNAVRAVAIDVLDFLIDFIVGWVGPDPDSDEFDVYHELIDEIRKKLQAIEKLADQRLRRVTRDLKETDLVVHCPRCDKRALVLDDIKSARCRFCHSFWSNSGINLSLALLYPEKIEEATNRCQACQNVTFLLDTLSTTYGLDNETADYVEVSIIERTEYCLKCGTGINTRHLASTEKYAL